MTQERMSDEMLMAYVDGELDASTIVSIERRAADDPSIAERIASMRETRRLAADAFADILREPVPDRLVAAIRSAGTPAAVSLAERRDRRRGLLRNAASLPLAASVAVALAGLGGYWLGSGAGDHSGAEGLGLLAAADPSLARALGEAASGERVAWTDPATGRGGAIAVNDTFRVAGDAFCRSFEVAREGDTQQVAGLGCRRDGAWRTEIAVIENAESGTAGTYSPASDAATQSLDAFLDMMEAQSVAPADEEALRRQGWDRPR